MYYKFPSKEQLSPFLKIVVMLRDIVRETHHHKHISNYLWDHLCYDGRLNEWLINQERFFFIVFIIVDSKGFEIFTDCNDEYKKSDQIEPKLKSGGFSIFQDEPTSAITMATTHTAKPTTGVSNIWGHWIPRFTGDVWRFYSSSMKLSL